MPRIVAFAVHAVDLPFRVKFEHAAASRRHSESLFVELRLDDGTTGWGESLPRVYVTGESRDSACESLAGTILPRLLGRAFESFEEVVAFLTDSDGLAPAEWVPRDPPQPAAWCAVDLALLAAFGKRFGRTPFGEVSLPPDLRYSGVLSSGTGWKHRLQPLLYRLLGFRSVKIKTGPDTPVDAIKRVRRLAGRNVQLRVDANMSWTVGQARRCMPEFARAGISSFEQPLAADDLEGAARLIRETGLEVMADESLHTGESLRRLIEAKACTAINARISKCGGLIATLARCREARNAGLWVQLGCQVGESSLLSAAHLHLSAAFPKAVYREGCFGTFLLAEDPARPELRFGRGGRPPHLPATTGLGVEIDAGLLARHRTKHWTGSV
ncbi:MAG TPA: enolase C-terminal domain-like protein [Luteolibacter sp.]